MSVVTRFAPSPTGFLHIGGARTALYNWLYARRHQGRFLLRIEDTDRARSTDDAVQAIFDGMRWLGLDWDGEAVSQFGRRERHAEMARSLLAAGQAYYCYCSQEELAAMREQARAEGRPPRYDGRWRDRDPSEAPEGVPPVIRLKAPQSGETVVDDLVQGTVTVPNEQLDDMVLLRADGTPTYMLSVVVDDHDMDVTHAIRGDDHLTNAFRQTLLYRAFGWTPPAFGHIPLIHGPDGAKLSKRHGALGVESYREQGFLPEAMCNYLLRLGWSHGDDEIISREEAVKWFEFDHVGRSAARFDMAKLTHLNGHYLREADDARLVALIEETLAGQIGRAHLPADARARLLAGMNGLKQRARTLVELAESAHFYVAERPIPLTDKAAGLLTDEARAHLAALRDELAQWHHMEAGALEAATRDFCERHEIKLKAAAQPLRAALTGSTTSPPIFEVAEVLGKEEVLGRLDDALSSPAPR